MAISNSKKQSQIQQDYNIISSDYSSKRSSHKSEKMSYFSRFAKPGQRILDLGCGDARFSGYLDRVYKYVGLDFSKKLLKIARQKYPKQKLIYGDMADDQTWNRLGRFDIIFAFASLHHLMNKKDQEKVLRFCYQALTKNGLLIITVWNLWQKKYWLLHLKQLAFKKILVPYSLSDGKKAIKTIWRPYYAFTPGEIKNLVVKQGFKLKEFRYFKGEGLLSANEFGLVAKK